PGGAGHHGVEVLDEVPVFSPGRGNVLVAVIREALEQVGPVGVDGDSRGHDLGGEVDHVKPADPVGQLEAYPTESALLGALHGDGDRCFATGSASLTCGFDAQEALVELDDDA